MAMSLMLCARALAAPSRVQIADHKQDTAVLLSLAARNAPRAAADPASALPFQRGDVFAASGGVQEYSPSGRFVQTIPDISGATTVCFDPSGRHLIVPGVGLFDSSGKPLASNWGSVPWPSIDNGGADCVADGFGNVYGISGNKITQFDLRGNVRHRFTLAFGGLQMSMDLAPDECTMYYAAWIAPPSFAGPFNVCTRTQESANGWQLVDDLRVLPNWEVLFLGDYGAWLEDTSGQGIRSYAPPVLGQPGGEFRSLALDPDGTSFWACCEFDLSSGSYPFYGGVDVWRFDINSGRVVDKWPLAAGPIAVYGPPLFGDANVEGNVDFTSAGTAEAFRTQVRYSGQLSRLHLWVDSSSTASEAVVGIYSDHHGHLGSLQTQGTITNLRPGSWNYVDVPSIPVTKGQRYWIAVLAPSGGGTLSIRDTTGGGPSQTTGPHKPTSLPAHWPHGKRSASAPVSAYGS